MFFHTLLLLLGLIPSFVIAKVTVKLPEFYKYPLPKHGIPFRKNGDGFEWQETNAINENVMLLNALILDARQLNEMLKFDQTDEKWKLLRNKKAWDCAHRVEAGAKKFCDQRRLDKDHYAMTQKHFDCDRSAKRRMESLCEKWRLMVQSLAHWLDRVRAQPKVAVEAQLKSAFQKLLYTPHQFPRGFSGDALYIALAKTALAVHDEILAVVGETVAQMEADAKEGRPNLQQRDSSDLSLPGSGEYMGTLEALQLMSGWESKLAENKFEVLPDVYFANEQFWAETFARKEVDLGVAVVQQE